MKTATSNFKELINNGCPYHYINLYLETDKLDVSFKSFAYYGLINSGDSITIGSSCASHVEFELYNQATSLEDKEVQIKVGVEVDGSIEEISLGYFTITKPSNKDEISKYTAYDRMIKLENIYVSELANPTTRSVMNEIGTKLGYGFVDNLTIDISLDVEKIKGYTYREMVGFISALHGANCVINDKGQIEFKWYEQTDVIVTRNRMYENGLELSSDTTFKVGYIRCATGETVEHTTTDDDGEERTETEDIIYSVGNGNNGINLSNPFMTQDILNNVYNTYFANFEYKPCKVNMLGNVLFECGDIVTVDNGSNSFIMPIMNITHTIDGGIITNIESVAQTETEQSISYEGPLVQKIDRVYHDLLSANKILASKIQASNITTDYLEANYATIHNLNLTNAKLDKIEADVGNITDLEAFNATITNLKTNKADINLANVEDASIKTAMIDDAQITTGKIADASITNAKIKEGAITEATIHNGAITTAKIADASITNAKIDSLDADKITTGTLKTERLILVDDETGNESVITALNREAINKLDGATIQDSTIEAAKIDVADLNAFEATIGGFDIDSSSIHSNKTAINDKTAGVYIGTTGIGVGDGELANVEGSPFEVYADGTVKMQGKNGSINFDAVTGDLDINVTNLVIENKTVATIEEMSENTTKITENCREIIMSAMSSYVESNQGVTVSGITKYYLASSLDVDVSISEVDWGAEIPILTQEKKYLWCFEEVTHSDGSISNTLPYILTTYNESAIKSIVTYYGVNSNKKEPNIEIVIKNEDETETTIINDLNWSIEIPLMSANDMYLWSYYLITYENDIVFETDKRIIDEYKYSFNELTDIVKSQLEILSDSITFSIENISKKVDIIDEDLKEQYKQITNYFKFDDDGLKIGSTYEDENGEEKESPFKVIIDEDEFKMNYLDDVPLSLNSQGESVIPKLNITKELNLFGYKISENNGIVNVEYIG